MAESVPRQENGILGLTAFLFWRSFVHLHLNHTGTFPHLSAAPFLQTWLPQAPSLIRTNSLCYHWKGYTYFLTTSLFKWWLRDEMSWPVKTNKVLVDGLWDWASLAGITEHCSLENPVALQGICIHISQKKGMNFSRNSSSIIAMLHDSYILQCISRAKCKLFYLSPLFHILCLHYLCGR